MDFLYTNGVFPTIRYSYDRMVHCIHWGVTSYNFQKDFKFLSLKIDFLLANSADPDEMPPHAAFLSVSSLFAKVFMLTFFFKQMRYTKKVSVWPVGLISSLKAEGCIVNDGKVSTIYYSFAYFSPLPSVSTHDGYASH